MNKEKLEKLAREILFNSESYPGLVARNKDHAKLIFWQNNSLGNFISWTFFETNLEYFIRRVVWHQHSEKLALTPITYGAEKMVSSNTFKNICNVIETVKFNNYGMDDLIAIDGVRQGIIFNGTRHSWLKETDPKLDKVFDDIINNIEESFTSHSYSKRA